MKRIVYMIIVLVIIAALALVYSLYGNTLEEQVPVSSKVSSLTAKDVQNTTITIAGRKNTVDARLGSSGDTYTSTKIGTAQPSQTTTTSLRDLANKYRTQTYTSSFENIGNAAIVVIGDENEASARILSQGDDYKEKIVNR